MTVEVLVELAWKSLVAAAIALVALRLLRGRSAAERALVAHLALVTLLLLPATSLLLPELRIGAPPAVSEAYRAVAEATGAEAALEPATGAAASEVDPAIRWADLVGWLYSLPAASLLLLTLMALVRLQRLRRRAEVLVDPRWLTALAAAQGRLGMRHGTALLASEEVASPISWGVIRPIIILDRRTAEQAAGAEAIIAHELAHVTRLDWLGLLLGRAACAAFWFDPFVWLLARQAHQLSEQAADDAVLRCQVPSADYAELLVASARHAAPPLALAANGVAPSRDSLGERVVAVLDPARSRVPARFGWT
ncbi:MAG: M56 family metallopeptidase, partial [Pseudomonadota bacterium]|nr:M56 family metallopeptidase [Pseudomonadota bacterium]